MHASIGKMSLFGAVAASVLLAALRAAPAELGFSGYAVLYPSYQDLDPAVARRFGLERGAAAALSRVRLEPRILLSRSSSIRVEYEISGLYDSSRPLFPIPAGASARQLFDLTWIPLAREHCTIVHTVDRCFFRGAFSFGEIVLGRQLISWGTGRVWNPTDLFNPINPASFGKIEKDGTDAVSVEIYLGSFSDVNLVVQPQETWEETGGGMRLRTHVGEYDLSFVGGRFDRRTAVGGDFAGNLLRAGVRGEGIVSFDPHEAASGFVKWILGIDQQFTSKLYGLLECHFNGEGRSDPAAYDLDRLERGEIINLGRRFLFLEVDYLLRPLWSLTATLEESLTDGSGLAGLFLDYSVSGSGDAGLGIQYAFGEAGDEFRFYPTILYLKGIYHF